MSWLILACPLLLSHVVARTDITPDPDSFDIVQELQSDKRFAIRAVNDIRSVPPKLVGFVRIDTLPRRDVLHSGRDVAELTRDVFDTALERAGLKADSGKTPDYAVDVNIRKLEFYETTELTGKYGHAVAEIEVLFAVAGTDAPVAVSDIVGKSKASILPDIANSAGLLLSDVVEISANKFMNQTVKEFIGLPAEEDRSIRAVEETERVVVERVEHQTRKETPTTKAMSRFFVGVNLTETLPRTTDIEISSGIGYGLYFGWRFPSGRAVRLRYFVSTHSVDSIPVPRTHLTTMAFGGFALDLKYHFLLEKRFQPYPLIGIGGYGLLDVDENGLLGLGINCGIGCDLFLNEHFSIGPEVVLYPFSYSILGVNGTHQQLDEYINGTMFSLSVLATYQF